MQKRFFGDIGADHQGLMQCFQFGQSSVAQIMLMSHLIQILGSV
jgi:hypothetical protein